MKNFIPTILLATILVSSCSKSNSDINENSSNFTAKDITTISIDNNQLYQIDILNSGSNINITNLTETLGVEKPYKALITGANFITVFTPPLAGNPYNFYVYQKNLINSTIKSGPFDCLVDIDEWLNIATRSEKKLIEFSVKPNGEFLYNFVRTYDLTTGNCALIELHTCQWYDSHNIYVDGENLYVTYRNEQGKYEINKINLNTSLLENQLEFDSYFSASIGDNKLHIFFQDGNSEVYNTSDFKLVKNLTYNLVRPSGFFESSFSGNEMYIDLYYPQPNVWAKRPGTVDLTTGSIIKDCNLVSLSKKLSEKLNIDPITFTTYIVDLKNNLIVCGFQSPDPKINGIVYTNFNADLLKFIQLDYAPDEIIIR